MKIKTSTCDFHKMGCTADGCVIYAEEAEQTVDHITLANFISAAEHIR